MLSCECEFDDYEYYYDLADDFTPLSTRRRQRCASCRELIDLGRDVIEVSRWREVESWYGGEVADEVHLASRYLCESCAGLYLRFRELGYCVNYTDDMRQVLKEYHKMVNLKD